MNVSQGEGIVPPRTVQLASKAFFLIFMLGAIGVGVIILWMPYSAMAGFNIGKAGVITSLVGFTFTMFQLYRSKNAADAVNESVKKATNKMGENLLIHLINQFDITQNEYSSAVTYSQIPLVEKSLVDYRRCVLHIAQILEKRNNPVMTSKIKTLRAYAETARLCKNNLASGPSTKPLSIRIKQATYAISKTAEITLELSTEFQLEMK